MSDEEDDDKQYEASQKKLLDARKKGEIAKSADLMTAGAYFGFLVVAAGIGQAALLGIGSALKTLLDHADQLAGSAFDTASAPLLGGILMATATAALPMFVGPAAIVVLVIVAQQAFVFAPSKLEPKLNRISPISGAKNKFGRRGLFEFAKSFVKLLLYGIILGVFLMNQIDRLVASMFLTPAMIMVELGRLILSLILIVVVVAAILGTIDYIWQRSEHLRKNRMSRKELMDEAKLSEGDPALKQKRRQKGMDLATNRMLADVPTADVIIVNPLHYAVALTWDRSPGSAPVLVAKGTDEVAARIREIATLNAIPIHADPPTARVLHAKVEVGAQIRQEHFAAVAAAIRFAERIRGKMNPVQS
jgi:flagellar biosynthetic protein FlhB